MPLLYLDLSSLLRYLKRILEQDMWRHVPTYIKPVLVVMNGLQTCLPTIPSTRYSCRRQHYDARRRCNV